MNVKHFRKIFSDCPLRKKILGNDFQPIMCISCLNFSYSIKSLTGNFCQFGNSYVINNDDSVIRLSPI